MFNWYRKLLKWWTEGERKIKEMETTREEFDYQLTGIPTINKVEAKIFVAEKVFLFPHHTLKYIDMDDEWVRIGYYERESQLKP